MKNSLDLIGEEEAEMFQAKIAHHQRLGGVEADVCGESEQPHRVLSYHTWQGGAEAYIGESVVGDVVEDIDCYDKYLGILFTSQWGSS